MASNPSLRSGIVPARPTTSHPTSTSPIPAKPSAPAASARQQGSLASAPRRIVLPTRYTELEPPRPLSAFIDDPLFRTSAAASILGVSVELLKKWRQRNQGPNYYQYGDFGPVRYALSDLMAYRTANLVRTGDQQ